MKIIATISIYREPLDRIEEIAVRDNAKRSVIANRLIKSALKESEVPNP